MMGLSLPPAATITDALSLVNAMLDPAKAKAALEQLRAEVAKLEKTRDEAATAQKRAEKMITEANAVAAALDARESEVAAREVAVAAKERAHELLRAEMRRKLASGISPLPAA